MKRLFTYYLLIVCCAFTAHAQYQLPNSGFEEWEDVSYSSYTGKEPVGWNSFLTGSGTLKSTADIRTRESDHRLYQYGQCNCH